MGATNPLRPKRWDEIPGFEFTDITYHRIHDIAAVRIAFNRSGVRNTFRPHTVDELIAALEHTRTSADIGCMFLTGNGPSPEGGGWAFCSGGDQRIRDRAGYRYADGETTNTVDKAKLARLHILRAQRLTRLMPKVMIALVNDWAAGGRHSLHVISDLTIASREHAHFKQIDADAGPFDGGFDSAHLARQMGQKFAHRIFSLSDVHDAQEAHEMGVVNKVVPREELEGTRLKWAARTRGKSPAAQRMLKCSFDLVSNGLVGQQVLLDEATRLAYMTDETVGGRDSFLERRTLD